MAIIAINTNGAVERLRGGTAHIRHCIIDIHYNPSVADFL